MNKNLKIPFIQIIPMIPLEKENCPGVYCILNTKNNKFYVGSGTRIASRLTTHLKNLKKGKHINDYLQNAFNLDKDYFQFLVLEYCDDYQQKEQELIDIYFDEQIECYNLSLTASHPTACAATRKKMSETAKRRWADPEYREKELEKIKEKFSTEEMKEILKQNGIKGAKKQQENPDFHQEQSAKALERWNSASPEQKEIIVNRLNEGVEKWLEDPRNIEKRSIDSKKRWANPEYKKRLKETLLGQNSKEYKKYLINPNDQEIFLKENLTQFCNEYNISRKCLMRVINGQRYYHEGWRLKETAEKIFQLINKKTNNILEISLKNWKEFIHFCKKHSIKNIGYFVNFLFNKDNKNKESFMHFLKK